MKSAMYVSSVNIALSVAASLYIQVGLAQDCVAVQITSIFHSQLQLCVLLLLETFAINSNNSNHFQFSIIRNIFAFPFY
jgi:hypothetical protein